MHLTNIAKIDTMLTMRSVHTRYVGCAGLLRIGCGMVAKFMLDASKMIDGEKENQMMQKVKYGVAFSLGFMYATLWWIVLLDTEGASTISVTLALSTIAVMFAVLYTLYNHWHDD